MTIFQRIINKEIPAQIIYEDDQVIAFYDIKPLSPGHFLVVPKTFSENFLTIADSDLAYLVCKARELAKTEIAKRNVSGFKMLVNNGKESGQEVFHTHVHIIPSLN